MEEIIWFERGNEHGSFNRSGTAEKSRDASADTAIKRYHNDYLLSTKNWYGDDWTKNTSKKYTLQKYLNFYELKIKHTLIIDLRL